jgi:hypothetical protein
MTQAVVQVRNIVARSGFANPLTLGVLVSDEDYVKVYADTTLLDNGPDYEITGIGDPNGISIEIIGAEDVDNYVGVLTFTALYDPPYDQQSDLSAGGVLGRGFETGLDQQNRRMQALADKVSRALRLTPNMDVDGELPWPPTDAFALVWDDALQRVVWADPTGSSVYADAAAASAAEAAAEAAEALAAAAAAAASAGDAAGAQAAAEAAQAAAELAQAAAEAAAASAANKLPLAGGTMTGPIGFTHQASPANPSAGVLALFAKSDERVYTRTSAGVETLLGGSGRAPIWMPGKDYSFPAGGGAGTAAIINAAIAAIAALGGGELILPPETISLDATIDNNVPNVLVRGLNRMMWNDAGTSVFGTLIVPTFAGTVLKHRTPYNGASQAQNRGGGFAALTVTGNAIATRLLEVDSVRLGTYDLYLANSVGTEAALFKCGVTGTDIGDAADIQDCSIDLRVRQTNTGAADDAHCVVFSGSSNANVSINTGIKLDLMHINGDGLVIESADNNVFELFRAYRPSGTGVSSRHKASAGGGLIAVSNVFQFYSSNTGAVVQGTDVAATPASAQIDFLDVANGTPMPTLGTAASCPVLNAVTTYTPTVVSRTGTITSVDSIEGRWTQDANKKVTAFVSFRVVTNGTGAGAIDVSLPIPMRTGVLNGNATGKEVAVTGKLLGGAVDTTNGAAIQFYDGVYPGSNGAVFRLKIEYEGY